MPPRPRALALGAAILATAAFAATASAASYSYDAGTHVLQVRAGTGETLHLEETGPNGQMLISGTDAGAGTVVWTDYAIPGLLAFYVPGSPPASGLTIQPGDGTGGTIALSRIELTDDTGPATWTVEGGTHPYTVPLLANPANALSSVRLLDMGAGAVDMGTQSLTVNAPDIIVGNDITAASAVTLTSPNPLLLSKATVNITAAGGLSTSTINGNAKNLVVHGPWWASAAQGAASAVSGAAQISVDGPLHPSADVSASTSINISGDLQPVPSSAPTLTAPLVAMAGGISAGPAQCGAGVIQGCDVGASSAATGIALVTPHAFIGGGVTLNGVVTVRQDQWTGVTRLRGGLNQVGGAFQVGGTLRVGGTDSTTLRTGLLATRGGLMQDSQPCVTSMITCGSIDEATPWATTRNVTVDAAEWATGFTNYMPGSITSTGPVSVAAPDTPGGSISASLQSDGPLNLLGGVQIPIYGSMTVSGAPTTLAGATAPIAAGSADTGLCNPGPLLSIGELRVTAPIECMSSLLASGPTWIGADVTTVAHQAYDGPVTVALGDGPRRLQAGGDAGVGFHQGVSAAWGPTPGAAGYRATAGSSACTTDAATFNCAFDPTPGGNDITFAVAGTLGQTSAPAAAPTGKGRADAPLPSGRTTRRSVAKGSRTPLTTLIVPPRSKGKRRWAEQGPCTIRGGRLVAPVWTGTCTVTLRVARSGRTRAWRGRAVVDVS